MNPDSYGDPFAVDDSPDGGGDSPADWPPGRPGRPYGVYPSPALGAEPWMTWEDVANMPRRQAGQSAAEAAAARAAYVKRLRERRGIAPPRPGAADAALSAPEAAPMSAPVPGPGDAESGAASAARRPAGATAGPPETAPAKAAASPPATAAPAKPLTRRQERFCQLFVVIGNATRAAWQAGYAFPDSRNRGYRLLRLPAIQTRIGELQRGLARNLNLDAEAMLGRLESAYHLAIEGEYYNAAARLVEVQARLAGHLAAARAVRPPAARNDDA